ncbi:MAG: UDP-N-acetylglucosamine 2-epimerase (non-hydrolyzing) [Nitrospirota bacterium]|nr:UDP-N-acetylglucosamine 2-epimerase (non-hydrolyzing) [Nitrospirota bacterium]
MQNFSNFSAKTKDKRRASRFLFIFGTRPEAIKLAPLIVKLKDVGNIQVCVTGQHREMLDQVLQFFSIVPDYDLKVMMENQSLLAVTSRSLKLLEKVIKESKPDLIIVQGDTTTTLVGVLAGFYNKIKVAHIEAGLRSFHKFSPFPEETNRVLVSHVADYHFAPTDKAKENLLREGISEGNIFVVGNTVIDALFMGLDIVNRNEKRFYDYFTFLNFSKRIILVTGHRRESFGKPFENICYALKEIAQENVEIIYPVHLNPNVRGHVYPMLSGIKNIHLVEPLDYPYLIWLMSKSYLILTDSGGIQEEAPSLGKPVLVLRDITERTEGIDEGTALLVGTDKERIVTSVKMLLSNKGKYNKMAKRRNPYGDGRSSLRIRDIVKKLLD